jgi:hypothetical protein
LLTVFQRPDCGALLGSSRLEFWDYTAPAAFIACYVVSSRVVALAKVRVIIKVLLREASAVNGRVYVGTLSAAERAYDPLERDRVLILVAVLIFQQN